MAEAAANDSEVSVVPFVDLERYAGKWYELARYPDKFEGECVRDVTATYTVKSATEIEVVNRCRKADGREKESVGTGRIADTVTNAKLQVSFAGGFLNLLPFVWGDYWVIYRDADYQYAVVSEPKREFLWILSRTPEMSEATYQMLLAKIAEKGFDVGKLQKTEQTERE